MARWEDCIQTIPLFQCTTQASFNFYKRWPLALTLKRSLVWKEFPLVTWISPSVRGEDPVSMSKILTVSDLEASDLIQCEINFEKFIFKVMQLAPHLRLDSVFHWYILLSSFHFTLKSSPISHLKSNHWPWFKGSWWKHSHYRTATTIQWEKESEKYFYSNHNFSKGEMSLSAASYYSWCRLLRFSFFFFF